MYVAYLNWFAESLVWFAAVGRSTGGYWQVTSLLFRCLYYGEMFGVERR